MIKCIPLLMASLLIFSGCGKKSGIPMPTISTISPASGVAGVTVTITGTNFDPTAANNDVKFNGTATTVSSASTTSLTVTAPLTGSTGSVSVTTSGGSATGPVFTYLQPPTVSSISPISGKAGIVVTINGTNFKPTATDNIVKFNGIAATVQSATSSVLTVLAPVATTGVVSVTTSDGTANGPTFTYLPTPAIVSINPTSGTAGSTVTITGTDFDANAANDVVKFNGVAATVTSASTTKLVVTVPATGTTGNITVTTTGGTSNGIAFTYTTGPDIYLAGGGDAGIGYWKNNTFTALSNCGAARSVFVSGTDVYVCGGNISSVPYYWKNGTQIALPMPSGFTQGTAESVVVSGTDVYIAGMAGIPGNTVPMLWKNGVSQPLALPVSGGDQRAFSVAVSGSDVYVAGNSQVSLGSGHQTATIWKNGVATYLTHGDYCVLYAVYINGSDVYACGQDNITLVNNNRYYWKNNAPVSLSIASGGQYECTGIGVTSSGDVYISGDWGISPQYWLNGTMHTLSPAPSSSSYGTGLFIAGNDVYECGNYGGANGSGYWKNGAWNMLNNAYYINAIFVK